MSNIGEYITQAREQKQYSQRKLARICGLENATISKIESGKIKNPNLKIIKILCRYLDITYEDCLYIMGLGASYNPNNQVLMNYYKNLPQEEVKSNYKNILVKINEYNKILSYLKDQFDETDNTDLLIDTIKSYEYENRTNNAIRKILEEKIINEYLQN